MKKLFIIFSLLIISSNVFAGGRTYVRGHFRKDGAYVAPHYRTSPDGSFYNNWSTYGNINPYTGELGKNLFPDKYKSHGYIKSRVPDFQLAPIPNEIGQTNRNNKAITPDISSYRDINSLLPSEVGNWIEKNAQQKWPNDFSMQAYTMQTQKEGYLRLQSHIKSFSQVGIPDNIFTWCLDLSKNKWPDDFSMQAYTFENNLEGYLKLSALISSDEWKGLPENVSSAILQQSYQTWSNDFSMQAYTVENQIDGFYELAELEEDLKTFPEEIIAQIKNKARRSWPKDLSMQAYTIRNEIEGYLRLKQLKAE